MTSEFGMAVHALTFLNHKGEMVSSEVLAENICTNPALSLIHIQMCIRDRCTAGTADIPVAEEAAQTAEYFGSNVDRIYDAVSYTHLYQDKQNA